MIELATVHLPELVAAIGAGKIAKDSAKYLASGSLKAVADGIIDKIKGKFKKKEDEEVDAEEVKKALQEDKSIKEEVDNFASILGNTMKNHPQAADYVAKNFGTTQANNSTGIRFKGNDNIIVDRVSGNARVNITR